MREPFAWKKEIRQSLARRFTAYIANTKTMAGCFLDARSLKVIQQMANPVKDTPVLTGADARRFEEAVKKNENTKVSRESYERALEVFKSVKLVESKAAPPAQPQAGSDK